MQRTSTDPQLCGVYRHRDNWTGAVWFGVMDDFGALIAVNFYQTAVSVSN